MADRSGAFGARIPSWMRPSADAAKKFIFLPEGMGHDTTQIYAHEGAHDLDPALDHIADNVDRVGFNVSQRLGGQHEVEIPAMAVENAYAMQHGGYTPSQLHEINPDAMYGPWIYDYMNKYGPQFSTDDPQLGATTPRSNASSSASAVTTPRWADVTVTGSRPRPINGSRKSAPVKPSGAKVAVWLPVSPSTCARP